MLAVHLQRVVLRLLHQRLPEHRGLLSEGASHQCQGHILGGHLEGEALLGGGGRVSRSHWGTGAHVGWGGSVCGPSACIRHNLPPTVSSVRAASDDGTWPTSGNICWIHEQTEDQSHLVTLPLATRLVGRLADPSSAIDTPQIPSNVVGRRVDLEGWWGTGSLAAGLGSLPAAHRAGRSLSSPHCPQT